MFSSLILVLNTGDQVWTEEKWTSSWKTRAPLRRCGWSRWSSSSVSSLCRLASRSDTPPRTWGTQREVRLFDFGITSSPEPDCCWRWWRRMVAPSAGFLVVFVTMLCCQRDSRKMEMETGWSAQSLEEWVKVEPGCWCGRLGRRRRMRRRKRAGLGQPDAESWSPDRCWNCPPQNTHRPRHRSHRGTSAHWSTSTWVGRSPRSHRFCWSSLPCVPVGRQFGGFGILPWCHALKWEHTILASWETRNCPVLFTWSGSCFYHSMKTKQQ